ncbi:MAG TPA: hypothetical protein VF086_09550 [Propionibacteriaceae bacterium]
MAYEWIGPVSAAVVGISGIFFTWLTGKQARDQAHQTADKRLDHERTMAHDAREQERRANAYVRLLTVVERIGQWAQMVKPMLDTNPPQEVRPMPDLDEQAEAMALVNAFGSDEIRQSFKSWRDLVWDMIWAVAEIDREQGSGKRYRPETSDSDEPYMKLLKLRPAEDEARQALASQTRAELQAARTS